MINELIEKLKKCDDLHDRCDYLMEHDEITYLLDYITNLQQENERLENNNQAMQEEMARTWKKENNYKSRCEKARIYIKKHLESWETEDIQNIRMLDDEFDVEILLNILNGRSDE